jgi:transposase
MRLVVSGDFELVCCCSLVALSHGASMDPYAAEESGCVVENCRRREPHLLAGSWIGKFAGHLHIATDEQIKRHHVVTYSNTCHTI